ncbi:MAG: peptidoglycan DD-metalloendopeptidase family protein [Thiogranum sp.]|nr:peptidoglycan DD-metalloendopeptidase family protein [Thiogranum sp.]
MTRLLAALLLSGLLSACGPQYIGPPIGDRSAAPVKIPAQHTVRSGDTLYSIAFMYGMTVEEIGTWNRIQEPYIIYRGQELRLRPLPATVAAVAPPRPAPPPVPASRPKVQRELLIPAPSQPKTAGRPASPRPGTSQTPAASRPKTTAVPAAAPASAPPTQASAAIAAAPEPRTFAKNISWAWPVEGPLLRRYDANNAGNKGIDIAGSPGALVRTAASGKVVYAGSGLSGYGRLIIIKHNDEFLSAYAHNRELVATEGQWVEKHDVIAHMGNSGTDRTGLHFEIRKRGRPVDPLDYLPRR